MSRATDQPVDSDGDCSAGRLVSEVPPRESITGE